MLSLYYFVEHNPPIGEFEVCLTVYLRDFMVVGKYDGFDSVEIAAEVLHLLTDHPYGTLRGSSKKGEPEWLGWDLTKKDCYLDVLQQKLRNLLGPEREAKSLDGT